LLPLEKHGAEQSPTPNAIIHCQLSIVNSQFPIFIPDSSKNARQWLMLK
jgi:hypothetical protein